MSRVKPARATIRFSLPVDIVGVVKVVAGTGGVTTGALIASDANGAGVAITPLGTGTAKQVVGVAMEPAAAGELFGMFIAPQIALT